MDFEFLKRLYRACSPDIAVDPGDLDALFDRLPAANDAHKRFAERLEQTKLPTSEMSGLEDLAAEGCLAYEEQGFINGFRLGFMLAQELLCWEVKSCPE